MRKLNFLFIAVACCFVFSGIEDKAIEVRAEEGEYYLGGMTAGFLLGAGGAEIIELNEVSTAEGLVSPAKTAGLKQGDCICAINEKTINSIKDLNDALKLYGEKEISLSIKRGGEQIIVKVLPVKEKRTGLYKIGVLIRDTLSGIGTVTYIHKESGKFAALGHSVCDENNNPLNISQTKVFACSVVGVQKGQRGKAGELRGLFLNDKPIAQAEFVCETGLYGTFSQKYDFSNTETVCIAPLSEATIGKAIIYSTIDGTTPQSYEIAIAKIDQNHKENKNLVLKITDQRLLDETGGIVQGMSGSPIVQNGKLIGAITHVFLNDPTRGYGIGIEKMIK